MKHECKEWKKSEVKQIIQGWTVNIETWMQRIEEIWGETNYTRLNSEYWKMNVKNRRNLRWNKLCKVEQWILKNECKE